ncbi:hypothetical protein AKO1_014344 [Acrasis kona]|uniref:WD repeat-containing protein 44 n=1 Tax=Acrasis kona TaxID=1008807 RepID=A0AAW2YYU4_9EUKA
MDTQQIHDGEVSPTEFNGIVSRPSVLSQLSEDEQSDDEYFEVDDVISPTEGGPIGDVVNVDPVNKTDEEILQDFVVKDLDTGNVSTLYQADTTLNPIYEHIVRKVKDYNDPTSPNSSVTSPTFTPPQTKTTRSHSIAELHKSNFLVNFQEKEAPQQQIQITASNQTEEPEEEETHDDSYIKVTATKKRLKQFSKLKKVQVINAHAGAIWVMKFNRSGQYLATGGQDGYVIIWKMNRKRRSSKPPPPVSTDTPLDELDGVQQINTDPDTSTSPTSNRGLFIVEAPYRKFLNGQSGDVLDLDWSKSNFLITSSMDKRVRVWHATREECLVTFLHSEIVTGVQFHPTNETLFITGSFDEKLRLFNLRQKALLFFADTKYMLTTVGFSGCGKIAMAGTFDGKCLFYQIGPTGMKKKTQIDVRSRRGKNKGRKVTGIVLTPDQSQVLVTTNDSRVRLYSLHDYSENCKYSGLDNQSSHIRATFDHSGKMIISGSEDHHVYLWNVMSEARTEGKNRVTSYESFCDHDSIVTNALFMNAVDDDSDNMNGRVIVTGDFRGELRVYENFGDPQPVKYHI